MADGPIDFEDRLNARGFVGGPPPTTDELLWCKILTAKTKLDSVFHVGAPGEIIAVGERLITLLRRVSRSR